MLTRVFCFSKAWPLTINRLRVVFGQPTIHEGSRVFSALRQLQIYRVWILATLLISLASCRTTDIRDLAGSVETTTTLPPRITIVTWNVQKAQNERFLHDLQHVIEEESPDLLFLQEASGLLTQSQFLAGRFAPSWRYPWPGGEVVGVINASTVKPLSVQALPSFWREFFVTAPKTCLAGKYLLPNGTYLLAINVHLPTFERWGTMKYRSQLGALKKIMAQHPGPIVLAGDFNTWSRKRLALLEECVANLRLTEVVDFCGRPKTGDKKPRFLNWLLGIDPRLALDRVYYRGLSFYSAGVLPYETSDHKALKVTLDLNDGNESGSEGQVPGRLRVK